MNKLREAGLYMASLVPIKGKMIARYNECLNALGISPTALESINIDAIGWSPEIAEEKDDIYYLNHGGANPYGIILTPEQKKKPVYFPFHSFDREVIDLFFHKNEGAIKDITTDASIVINLDQNIDAYYEPSDLIDYDVVTVGYNIIGDLGNEQIKQKELIKKMYEGNNCLNMNLHSKILASAIKYGDLRSRNLHLNEIDFQTQSYYTKAFGGVFVLRSNNEAPLLVFESKEEHNNYNHSYETELINSPTLLANLKGRGYFHFNLTALNKNRLDRISQFVFSHIVKDAPHSISEIFNNKSLYIKYLNEMTPEQKVLCTGPERYIEKLAKGHQPNRHQYIPESLYGALHTPVHEHHPLFWIMLCHMYPTDPYLTYYYDKELFYKEFNTYTPAFQDWVIEMIQSELKTLNN